jgi:hypothetical protein
MIILLGLALAAFSALVYLSDMVMHMGESFPSVP